MSGKTTSYEGLGTRNVEFAFVGLDRKDGVEALTLHGDSDSLIETQHGRFHF